ncbi:SubName: Full=Related to insulysin (Metalloendopeptidase) {ECO:0000313/EMBL:CCA70310.1} [Serendipita indica DSM 11827]|nr:SubName: Full=Related to insulysin (Metalloendopeptidase) {ECO:0000313/EMBL:CCA70310.1} [Serendipita indica DSM 11827]
MDVGVGYFNGVKVCVLVNGNFEEKDALAAAGVVRRVFKPLSIRPEDGFRRSMILTDGNFIHNRPLIDLQETNNAVSYYIQVRGDGRHTYPRLRLLDHILSEPTFNVLRTKEQLGYSVSCSSWKQVSVCGLIISVQSEKPAAFVEGRIDAFLTEYCDVLKTMEQGDYEKRRNGLVHAFREKLQNLEESDLFAGFITNGTYDFTFWDKLAQLVEKLTLADIPNFLFTCIPGANTSSANSFAEGPTAESQTQETVSAVDKKGGKASLLKKETVIIDDIVAFKSGLQPSELPKAAIELRPKFSS